LGIADRLKLLALEIHLYKIPSNLKNPSCEGTMPTDYSVAELYSLLVTTICRKTQSRPNQGGTGENLVEMGGV